MGILWIKDLQLHTIMARGLNSRSIDAARHNYLKKNKTIPADALAENLSEAMYYATIG